MPALILTYHSHVVGESRYGETDHVSLAADLRAIHAAGLRLMPLSAIERWKAGEIDEQDLPGQVAITFDDGCRLDVASLDYPGRGSQTGFLQVLETFAEEAGGAQPGLHATTFVIACADARDAINEGNNFPEGWMDEDWWHRGHQHPLLSVQNHSWNHNQGGAPGSFADVDDEVKCELQVGDAQEYIAAVIGETPTAFAYPFGDASAFLVEDFLPRRGPALGLKAAYGTRPGLVTAASDRWSVPRYVCGHDWKTPEQFALLLSQLQA